MYIDISYPTTGQTALKFILGKRHLEITSTYEYLGVIVYDQLHLDDHFDNVIFKFAEAVAMKSKLKLYAPRKFLRPVYCTLFQSHV